MSDKTQDYDGSTPLSAKKMEQFCLCHLSELNATQAAKDAGYAEKTAAQMASRLLTNVKVQKRLEYLREQSVERVKNSTELQLDGDRVLEEVARIAFANINDFITITEDGYAFIDLSKATPAQLAAISSVEVIEMPPMTMMGSDGAKLERQVFKTKIKFWDKGKQLENLMKHFGLIKEKVEVDGLDKMIAQLQRGRERVANRPRDEDDRV